MYSIGYTFFLGNKGMVEGMGNVSFYETELKEEMDSY